jgi:hypothetical protein
VSGGRRDDSGQLPFRRTGDEWSAYLLEKSARASHGVDSTAGHCMPARSTGYRVTRSALRALFPSPKMLPRTDRPPTLANWLHSLVPDLPFGVPSSASLPLLSELPSCQGSVPLRGITGGVHACRASQLPAAFRPQVFSTSRRFAPPSALRAYCIPQPRPGFHRSGVSPASQPPRLVAGSCPHAVVLRALTGKPAATRGVPDFEALLRAATRSSRQGVNLPRGRSPLRLSPPSGPRFPAVSPVPRVLRS